MTADCGVFKFLRRSVDGKHLIHFQSETSVFRFLRRSVDTAQVSLREMNKNDTLPCEKKSGSLKRIMPLT